MEPPLGCGGQDAEGGPDHQVAQKEHARRYVRNLLLPAPAVDPGEHEDHRSRRRRHHGNHHHRPHDKRQGKISSPPGLHLGHGHLHPHVHVDGVADLDPVAKAIVDVLDRRSLHTEVLADEWEDVGYWATHLPREDAPELLGLLVARPLIHEHPDPPVALRHLSRSVEDQYHAEVAHIRAVDLTGVDVPGEHCVAAFIISGRRETASATGANDVAVAVLDIGTFESPGHILISFLAPSPADRLLRFYPELRGNGRVITIYRRNNTLCRGGRASEKTLEAVIYSLNTGFFGLYHKRPFMKHLHWCIKKGGF